MRCNDFVVTPNTLDAKQGHRASFFHRGQQVQIIERRGFYLAVTEIM